MIYNKSNNRKRRNLLNIFDNIVNKNNLRTCQKEAYEKILSHFSNKEAEKHILIQLPTGTGKSALIAIIPFNLSKKKVLILTPNVKLSNQLANELDVIENLKENIYARLNIFESKTPELYVLRLESSINSNDINDHHIIVSNYHQLSDLKKWFNSQNEIFDLIIIDEAHHQNAKTYQGIIKYFKNAIVVGLTATPFRSDGKKVSGLNLYTYHFHEAISAKIIRNIKCVNISPEKISFNDSNNKTYTLNDILSLKEDSWFNNGVALSADCCKSIAAKSFEKLLELRKDFPETQHQIVACAMSIRHATHYVVPAFKELGLKVDIVHSDNQDNDKAFNNLKYGKIDVIVSINMLGEGFDHPKLGVAAIFRPYKSLNPYIQFIGRVIRRNEQTKHCYVVSHIGLNQISRFQEFKLFDSGDKEFLEKIFSNETEEINFVENPDSSNSTKPSKNSEPLDSYHNITINEIGNKSIDFESSFISEKSSVDIDAILSEISKMPQDKKEDFFKKLKDQEFDDIKLKDKVRLKPVNKRKTNRYLLDIHEKTITNNILKKLNLDCKGNDLTSKFNNFAWVKIRISEQVNLKFEIETESRKKITNDQYSQMMNIIKEVEQECLIYFTEKLNDKKNMNSSSK